MVVRLICVFLLVAIVAGCDQGVVPQTSTPETSAGSVATQPPERVPEPSTLALPADATPGPSESPAAVAMTMEEAASAYLAIAKEYNRASRAARKKYKDEASLKKNRKWWAADAANSQRFADRLKELVWPEEVAADVTKLVRFSVMDERRERACARAKSWTSLVEAARIATKGYPKTGDQAAIVRDILGLPSN